MGFRFRKSFKIIPGVRLNIGKKGISTTVGKRGLSVNIGKKGAYLNAGIPGTGISYREKISGGTKRPRNYRSGQPPIISETPPIVRLLIYGILGVFCLSFAAAIFSLLFNAASPNAASQTNVSVIAAAPADPVAPIPNISFELKSVIADSAKSKAVIEGTLRCADKPCPQTVWISLYAFTAYNNSPADKNHIFPAIEVSRPFANGQYQYVVKKELSFDSSGTNLDQSANGLYVRTALSETSAGEAEQRLNITARELGRAIPMLSKQGTIAENNRREEEKLKINSAPLSGTSTGYGGGTVSVRGYYRRNGTYVRGYTRRR